jgi:hypothetical protein
MRADESKTSAIAFLEARVEHFAAQGVRFKRLLTDNGPADRSKLFNETCQALGIKHTYTRPYTPQTNGKVERFTKPACMSGPTVAYGPTAKRPLGCTPSSITTTTAEPTRLSSIGLPPHDSAGTTY